MDHLIADLNGGQLGLAGVLLVLAVTLARIVERLIDKRLFGGSRDSDGRFERVEQRVASAEAELSRLRDSIARIFERLDDVARGVARIEGRLDVRRDR